jgi:2-methylcitrate dehydratase PrpD
MTSPTASERLAAFTTDLRFDDLPPEVVLRAKELMLDLLGVSLAARAMPASEAMVAVVRAMSGAPESTVWGSGERVPASNAALANGTMAHGLDYDDTQLPAQAHMSASVVPAALAAAEAVGADGRATIAACVAGWEVGLRIGAAAPGKFIDFGFHPTGICGAFASAVVAGKLWGLSASQLVNALGIAGSQAAGLMAFLDGAAWSKKMHPGWAAHSGIIAALLAREGFTGPRTIFEGRFGIYNTHIHDRAFDLETLTAGLGSAWEMLRISMKPYPACHFNHTFIDAALYLRERYGLRPEDIERIDCKITAQAIPVVCEPREQKVRPKDGYAAQFSLPYGVAVALVRGKAGLAEFADTAIDDPRVLDLAARVTHSVDPESDFPLHYPGWVVVTLRDGRVLERREPIQRGTPERPLRTEEVVAKFRDCVASVLDSTRAEALVEQVMALEQQARLADVVRLCTMASGGATAIAAQRA